jgi:hypothetical protein
MGKQTMAEPPRLFDQFLAFPSKTAIRRLARGRASRKHRFNGVEGMTTLKMRFCGVKLVWDEYENATPIGNTDDVTPSRSTIVAATTLNRWRYTPKSPMTRRNSVVSNDG